jgi:hypothetical protein
VVETVDFVVEVVVDFVTVVELDDNDLVVVEELVDVELLEVTVKGAEAQGV